MFESLITTVRERQPLVLNIANYVTANDYTGIYSNKLAPNALKMESFQNILNADGSFTGTAVSGYTGTNNWQAIEDKTLYALFDRTYGENIFVKKLRPLFNHLDLCFRAIVKRRWSNLKVFRAAYYDGTHNILGKRVNPGKEFEWSRHK